MKIFSIYSYDNSFDWSFIESKFKIKIRHLNYNSGQLWWIKFDLHKRILFYFTKGQQTLVDSNRSNSDMPAKNAFGWNPVCIK